jgi:hypothetical protein
MAPVVPFPRPLFPPSHDQGPVTNGDDIIAVKRAVSRAGFFLWRKFDDIYSETFAMEGIKEFQKQAGLIATGNYGQSTHDVLRNTRSKAKPDEWAFDKIAIDLMKSAKRELTPANTNLELKKAREILAFCRQFDGSYLYGGEHDGSFADDDIHDRFDCSSSTSFVLWKFNLLGSTQSHVSSWFETWGESGRGKYITIHANWEHVWMEFSLPEGYFRFDTSPHGDGGGGPRVRTRERSDYNFVHRHPKGF